MRKPIGLYGGAFDPYHEGHHTIITRAVKELKLDSLYVCIDEKTKYKTPKAKLRDRWLDVSSRFEDEDHIKVIPSHTISNGFSAPTFNIVQGIHLYIKIQTVVILGADSWNTIENWEKSEELFHAASFAVVSRPGYQVKSFEGLKPADTPEELSERGRIYLWDLKTPDISSSRLRANPYDYGMDRA